MDREPAILVVSTVTRSGDKTQGVAPTIEQMAARSTGVIGACLLVAAVLGAGPAARAEVERFAVLLGNNRGAPGEVELRYAERDARRLGEVLVELGEFPRENVVTLTGATAGEARRALLAVNERVRRAIDMNGAQPMLLVFYSGHADAEALHLQGTQLALREVEHVVAGSAAGARLLITDSCRSGALTRVKGAKLADEFPLAVTVQDRLAGEGFIVLTSAAAGEDAQESDEVQGSFFTHALLSGLQGAADVDGDGAVVLSEAYQYAYQTTLRASSRTLAGSQHPTFRYDLRGRGELVLTRPGVAAERARLELPAGASWLVLAGDDGGEVVAEVSASDTRRTLSLRPGRHWVRGRAPQAMLEGEVTLFAGGELTLDPSTLTRTEYARLVRKGGGASGVVSGPAAAFFLRGRASGDLPGEWCPGAQLAWPVELGWIGVVPHVEVCQSDTRNNYLDITTVESVLGVNVTQTWDARAGEIGVSVGMTGGLGAGWFWQRFTTAGVAPDRSSLVAVGSLGVTGTLDLVGGSYLSSELGVRAMVWPSLSYYAASDEPAPVIVGADAAPYATFGVGWWL